MCNVNFWTLEDVRTVGHTYSHPPICVGLAQARPKNCKQLGRSFINRTKNNGPRILTPVREPVVHSDMLSMIREIGFKPFK